MACTKQAGFVGQVGVCGDRIEVVNLECVRCLRARAVVDGLAALPTDSVRCLAAGAEFAFEGPFKIPVAKVAHASVLHGSVGSPHRVQICVVLDEVVTVAAEDDVKLPPDLL